MSYDIDGKPLFDPYRIESAGPAWDPHREYPEPEPEGGAFSRPELLRVAREELLHAEHHLNTARDIKAEGNGAHCVPYWEREVAHRRDRVVDLETRPCDQCGAAGAITVTDAGDFCACGAEVQ